MSLAHSVPPYTHLFSLFYYFLYIADPPPHTPLTQPPMCDASHLLDPIPVTPSDWLCLFDGQMIYNSHVTFPFLVTCPCCGLANHESPHHAVSLVLTFLIIIHI